MKSLRIYKTRQGKQPFVDWVEELKDKIAVAQVNNRVSRFALGLRGDYKRVAKGGFELRIHYGPGYRVYFAKQGKDIILLLLGGDKSTQKRDIKQATIYWADYKAHYHE